jgi:hypothetical protein
LLGFLPKYVEKELFLNCLPKATKIKIRQSRADLVSLKNELVSLFLTSFDTKVAAKIKANRSCFQCKTAKDKFWVYSVFSGSLLVPVFMPGRKCPFFNPTTGSFSPFPDNAIFTF